MAGVVTFEVHLDKARDVAAERLAELTRIPGVEANLAWEDPRDKAHRIYEMPSDLHAFAQAELDRIAEGGEDDVVNPWLLEEE